MYSYRMPDHAEPAAGMEPEMMIGSSAAMRDVERALARLATADVNLLLRGEIGTGKRVLAESIHRQSQHSSGRLPVLSLAGISEARAETELFGDEGSGGLVAQSRGGGLYLEHIETLSSRLQRRLVQALDTPGIGGDLRLIAGTTVELEELVRLGRFRADLYFHLPVRVTIPPLRERREDVAAIATQFMKQWSERTGSPRVVLGRSALAELSNYSWPGNARELQQTLEAALRGARGADISAERIRAVLGRRPRRYAAADVFPLRQLERDYIATVLSRCNWNQSLAARRLGIGRNTLLRKIKTFGLDKAEAAA